MTTSTLHAMTDRDAARLGALFDRWADDVWRVLRRAGLRREDAEDGLQQVFLVVARRLDDILPGRERAFLCAIALKVAVRLRQRRVLEFAELVDPPEPECLDGPHHQLERRRLCAQLDRLLGRLDEGTREVVALTHGGGLSRRETAAALGLAEGTVASRLRRAHVTLAAALHREHSSVVE